MAFYNNETNYNDFLIKNNLSPNQFDFCWKLYNHKIKNSQLDKIYKCFNEIKRGNGVSKYITASEIEDLIEMKFVGVELNTKSKFPDIYNVTDKFYKELFVQGNIAFQELLDNYPKTIHVNGIEYNALNIDFEEAERLYKKKIGSSLKAHNSIIQELQNQVKLDKINSGLDKWLKSESWRLNTVNTTIQETKFV